MRTLSRALAFLVMIAAVLLGSPLARAGNEDDGIPVTVRVIDPNGEPIPTAVVRHPQEQDRHRVNTETGMLTLSVLYLPDGSEILFEKGMSVDFEVSAPGYVNKKVTYVVRKRRNTFDVTLDKMTIDMSDDDPDDITIQFGRDKPID
jgi:hypothetical protein